MSAQKQIKFYEYKPSPSCQRVKVVLEEKKLSYETVPVDLKRNEQKKPEFLKLSPYGKVPVIVDGETVVYESRIINEYLDEKYPEPPLMPKDPAGRAKVRILIDYDVNHIWPSYQKVREQMVKDEKERDRKALENAVRELKSVLQRLEEEMGSHPYLAGDFSLLDAAVIPWFLRLGAWGILPDPSLPRLSEWLQRMKDRPSVRAAM